MSVLLNWLGAGGKPVDKQIAEERAAICITCPKNVALRWWEAMTKDPIAEAMRVALEVKHGMVISTSKDEQLGVCQICGCCLPLKVHVPMEHIKDVLKDNSFSDAPDYCWIKKGLQN